MYLGNNAALLGCQEYFNRCAAAGSPIGGTQTPTSYDNAARFNGTNQFLSIPSNSTLQSGAGDFTFSLWLRLSTASGVEVHLNKGGSATLGEYNLWTSGGTLNFQVVDTAGNPTNAQSSITLVANTWYHVVGSYVASSRVSSVRVNDSASNSGASNPNAANQGSLSFEIGARSSALFSSASIASVGFWKRALTASEVTALFNNGAGRTYASLDSGLRNNLVSWWALNQNSVTADSHGTNTLTNNGSVTAPNIGPVVTALSDPRQLIIDFAQGIDRLGLWNSMVCWPLRSSQNGRSGTTAFSLGGLGRFDGTLVNAPVWGANGMIFASASGTRINISNDPIFAPQNTTWGAMCVSSQTSGTRADVFGKTGSVDALADLSWGMRESNTTATLFITDGATFGGFNVSSTGLNLFRSSVMSYDNTLITGRVNGGTASTFSYTPNAQQNTSQVLRIGAGTLASATNFNGPVAFALFGYFSASQQVALHSLYRQTLGLGLGLP
jgi:hypothetical protein